MTYDEDISIDRVHQVCEGGLLYSDLTYTINGVLMSVHNQLGPGWDEGDYHRLFVEEISNLGLSYQSLLRGRFTYREEEIDRFELDVLVEDAVIVELKHVQQALSPAHYIQLINYMTFWKKAVGLLCNFGQESLRLRRLSLHTEVPLLTVMENTDAAVDRSVLTGVISVVQSLADQRFHTYCLKTFGRLLRVESRHTGIKCERLFTKPNLPGKDFSDREVDAWCINDNCILRVAGNPKGPAPQDKAILKNYIKHSGLSKGILVNISMPEIIILPISIN